MKWWYQKEHRVMEELKLERGQFIVLVEKELIMNRKKSKMSLSLFGKIVYT